MIKQGLTITIYPWVVEHDPHRIAMAAVQASVAIAKMNPAEQSVVDVTDGLNVVATVRNVPSLQEPSSSDTDDSEARSVR